MKKTILAIISRVKYEPGTHATRKVIETVATTFVTVPWGDCHEVRPDWGEYLPLKTLTALERALRARGELKPLRDSSLGWFFGFA
tara:strand:+ start:1934 stop:2188 length:255 start_codon:yes stop_codon:yes gene_type:complete